jgi:hypothetical protein
MKMENTKTIDKFRRRFDKGGCININLLKTFLMITPIDIRVLFTL